MISIAYCGDRSMLKGLRLSLLSILQVEKEPLDIWVITAENAGQPAIKAADLTTVASLLHSHRGQLHLHDISAAFHRDYPVANEKSIFSVNCMLRLFLDLIPGIPDRLLYLDTDVLCRQDFSRFFHQPLGKYVVAGVLDYYGRWVYHHHLNWRGMDYLNSGVLLLNMPLIRRQQLFQKCRSYCRYHQMFLPDQEALNKFVKKKKFVSARYNDQHGLHKRTVFQHFTTQLKFFPRFHPVTIKPWEFDRVHSELGIHAYDDLFDKYQQLFNDN